MTMTIQDSIDQMIAALRSAIDQHGMIDFDAFDLHVRHGAPATETQVKIAGRAGSLLRVRQAFPHNEVSTRRPSGSSSNLTWIIKPNPGQRMAALVEQLS
jgi:hypothetical protein